MKKKVIILLVAFFLMGCDTNHSNSRSSEPSSSISVASEKKVLFEKHFSKTNDDSFENFYAKGWSAANAKFGTNSIILLEDETHKYGSGYVHTPEIGSFKGVQIGLSLQVTGFNNASDINQFVGQTFAFDVLAMNKVGEEYKIEKTMTFSHLITQEDTDNKYFSSLNPYTSNPQEAKTLYFDVEETFSVLKVSYKSKPHYQIDGKDNGVNLELFSITIWQN